MKILDSNTYKIGKHWKRKMLDIKKSILIFCTFLLLCSCEMLDDLTDTFYNPASHEDYAFYQAVRYGSAADVEDFLKRGRDPNYMNAPGAKIWRETNPLWVLNGFDYEKEKILLDYNANTTNRPYIAKILFRMYESHYTGETVLSEDDVCRAIQLYLDYGANPNSKCWHESPWSVDMVINFFDSFLFIPPTDETYKKVFNEYGVTALNLAIELNLFSVVDLLFANGAVLDGDSLAWAQQATEFCGGNPMMENKIRALLAQ